MARWLDEANCPVMDFVCYVLHHKPSLPDMNCMTRKSQARKAGKTIFASKLDHFAHLKKEVTSCVEKRSLQSFVSLFSWHYTYTRMYPTFHCLAWTTISSHSMWNKVIYASKTWKYFNVDVSPSSKTSICLLTYLLIGLYLKSKAIDIRLQYQWIL